jgi:hypothetical protein
MSWLSKDVLDALEHAGYVAVPKERTEKVSYSIDTDMHEVLYMGRDPQMALDITEANRKRMAVALGMELMEKGFIAVEMRTMDSTNRVRNTATIYAVKPR